MTTWTSEWQFSGVYQSVSLAESASFRFSERPPSKGNNVESDRVVVLNLWVVTPVGSNDPLEGSPQPS